MIRKRRWLRLLLIGTAAVPILTIATFWAAVFLCSHPRSAALPPHAPSKWFADRDGVMLAELAAPDGQWRMPLTVDQISPHLLAAIVAVEDHRFYRHGGVDWRSVAGAAWQDLSSLRIRRGASTITMQLHRLREPAPRRSLFAKFEQAVRAAQIERTAGKQQILVEYLNRAPFGGNIIGAGAASRLYFGRSCADLSLAQAALLAGLPQNPNRLRPDRHPQLARARRDVVLGRMLACGMISRSQHDDAVAEPVDASWHPLPQNGDRAGNESAADDAHGALPTLIALSGRGDDDDAVVTLDAAIQRQAYAAASRRLQDLAPSGVGAAAVVVLDTRSGECRTAVSVVARPDQRNALDLTARPRSTGSILKPFIYAAAFDQRLCAPDTVLTDTPSAWSGFVPRNYDKHFRGAMTAADALAQSRNLPALQLLARVGVERAVATMSGAGLSTLARKPNRYGLSLATGGADASPMEVAAAYATLARGGVYQPPRILHTAPTTQPAPRVCFDADACWQTLVALNNIERTAAVSPQAAGCGAAVAWKTGTSSDNRDAWCAAVTSAVTVVVWMGNLDGRGSSRLVGVDAAAPLALDLAAALTPRGVGETWPAPSSAKPQAADAPVALPVVLLAARSSRLTLISPADGTEIAPDPDAPPAAQKLLLHALPSRTSSSSPSSPPTLWWFVDGRNIAAVAAGERAWWSPTPGDHEVRVVDPQGHWAAARVHVRRADRADRVDRTGS